MKEEISKGAIGINLGVSNASISILNQGKLKEIHDQENVTTIPYVGDADKMLLKLKEMFKTVEQEEAKRAVITVPACMEISV